MTKKITFEEFCPTGIRFGGDPELIEIYKGWYEKLDDCVCSGGDTNITRLEIISNKEGRHYVKLNLKSVELSLQDRERTLKIFIEE